MPHHTRHHQLWVGNEAPEALVDEVVALELRQALLLHHCLLAALVLQ